MPRIRFGSPEPSENGDFGEDTGETPKWFDIFKNEPTEFEEYSSHSATAHKIEAQKAFEDGEKSYQLKISKASRSSDEGWIRTIMQKGTSGDKGAALILSVQKSPVNNFNALSSLISMVKISKKKQCTSVLENLCELLVDELLPPGKKLRSWPQHPFKHLTTLTNGKDRSKVLATWLYETKLKEAYSELIVSLEAIAKDTVDAYREKAITAMYKLLSAHPEQEEILLKSIVNKLGDPVQKVVSKVMYCLTQLLRVHPNMKLIVMNEVEKLLFRPNIGARTQYYAICFLSQFVFSNEDEAVARYIIKVYFSFFKSSIKKGEVDSRLMGALLMGVKRAYPFAKLDATSLDEHISTLYKLVHISPFNISLHTLCLLEQVSVQSEDRFYNALYKKLLDPKLVCTSYQAIFINLMYKALSKDENVARVIAIIKRIFQVCLQMPVCFLCGMLYMVSQLTKNSKLLITESKAVQFSTFDNDDSEDERYYDADKTNEGDVKPEVEEKKVTGWNFVEYSKKSRKDKQNVMYDPNSRNPAYCHADSTAYFELLDLSNHFHPTVALFASKIMNGEFITYSGDPLSDFSLVRFLERFSFKNPKVNLNIEDGDVRGPDPKLAQRKYYKPSGPKAVNVNSHLYLNQESRFIPVDEIFLYRYLKEKNANVPQKRENEDDFDDNDSVASEEFEELLDSMMGKKAARLDFMEDVGDKLKKGKQKLAKGMQPTAVEESENEESESEDEEEEVDEEDVSEDDDEEPSDVEIGTDEDEAIEFDEGSGPDEDIDIDEFLNESSLSKKSKIKKLGLKKSKKGSFDGLFAPAEEFSELLEEAGSSKARVGMAHSLANPENAAEKQLNWEVKRDRWIRGANDRKRKFNKPAHKFNKRFKN